jgi:hypothetical protein
LFIRRCNRTKEPGVGGHGSQRPALSVEEATRLHHEFEAEQKRLGIKSNAVMNAEARAKLKAIEKAERHGEHFIGPPNP